MKTLFRTPVQLPKYPFQLDHEKGILSLGSCFASNIGQRLLDRKFNTLLHPFGILYNPTTIAQNLNLLLDNRIFNKKDLVFDGEIWHSFHHHSCFSGTDSDAVLEEINRKAQAANNFLKESPTLLLTLGTAYVFKKKSTQQVVANCHKFPNTDFERSRLSVTEIVEVFSPIFQKLTTSNIILTVSPIRHLSDGIIENQRSKAILLLAIEALSQQFPNVFYFPAYEILMDDLRDYRFYEKDLIHPNEQAIDYVWNLFAHAFFDKKTTQLINQIEKIRAAVQHRAFHPNAASHQLFLKNTLQKIAVLKKENPRLNFDKETEQLQAGILT